MITLREIATITASIYGVPLEALKGPSRVRELARTRQAAFALMQAHGKASYPQIGYFFDRHHTTVMFGVREHAKRYLKDISERRRFDQASKAIQTTSTPVFKSTRGRAQ